MSSLDELKTHTFIVMGTEHYNPLGAIRSLGENGIKPVFIVLKAKVRLPSFSRYCGRVHFVADNEEALSVLVQQYGNEKKKPVVIPTEDTLTELLDKNYDSLKDLFYISNAGKAGRISAFTNKKNICELAKKHGLAVATSWAVQNGEIPDDIMYPVITKPMTSYDGWKSDYHICHDEAELKAAYEKIRGEEILLQQYITKVNELCLDGFVVNQGKTMFVSIASTYTYILPDYYSMEMEVKNFNDERLQAVLQDMFAEIGFEGIFSTEFMIDEAGTLWFLEINFRHSTWSWASTKVGMNLPLLWAEAMITGTIPSDAKKTVPEHCIALAEIQDYMHRVRRLKMISTSKWLGRVFAADILYFFDWKDIKPFVCYCVSILLAFVSKKHRKAKLA